MTTTCNNSLFRKSSHLLNKKEGEWPHRRKDVMLRALFDKKITGPDKCHKRENANESRGDLQDGTNGTQKRGLGKN